MKLPSRKINLCIKTVTFNGPKLGNVSVSTEREKSLSGIITDKFTPRI